MSFGAFPPGAEPIGAIDDSALPTGVTLIDRLARGDSVGIVNFVEIFGRALAGDTSPAVDPIAALPIGALPEDVLKVGAQASLLMSDREWCGHPDDTYRPNQLALPVLISGGDYQTRAPLYPDEARRLQTTVAAARIIDEGGFFSEFLKSYSIDAARAVVFFGEEAGYSDEHEVYFEAVVKNYERDGKIVTVYFDTAQSFLDTAAQGAKYTGAGGAGGDARLKDRYIPEIFGPFFNAEPVLEEYEILSYRISVGEIDGYDRIKDKGVPLVWDGRAYTDYADYKLAAITDPPPAGKYMLGPDSRFALGAKPIGRVTCDGRGSVLFGVYSATTRAILRYILGSGKPLGLSFDEATFGVLPDDEISFYLDGSSEVTKADIVNALLPPFLAWLDVDPSGRLAIARAGDPDGGPAVDSLAEDDIRAGWSVTAFDQPVRASQEVTYARNWAKMDPGEIADPAEQPLVSVDDYNALQREEEVAKAGDLSILNPFPSAKPGPRLRGYFTGETGAQTAADDIFAFFGARLQRVAVPVDTYRVARLRRGQRVAVTHSEITLGATKNMTVLEINPSPSKGVTEVVGVMKE